VLKYESRQRDEEYLAWKAGVGGFEKLDHLQKQQKQTMDFVRELTAEEIRDLYEIFKIDFELFDYSAEKYFKVHDDK
jgi:predicted transcriptional regulator